LGVRLTTPTWKRLVTKSEEAEPSEEGQGPRRAVEPMMMMMNYIKDNEVLIKLITFCMYTLRHWRY
jgi:hypothetical protein